MSDTWTLVLRCALDLAPSAEWPEAERRLAGEGVHGVTLEGVRRLLAHSADPITAERKAAAVATLEALCTEALETVDDESEPAEDDPGARAGTAALLPALAAGKRRAFESLFADWADRLVRYVHRYVGSREEAEDLVQDLFLRLWDRRAEFRRVGDLEAYLYTCARNRAVTHLRRRRVEAEWRTRVVDAETADAPAVPDPAAPLAAAELTAALQRAIDGLPRRQREVMLRYWRGERNVDIAAALGISPKTIGVHVNRAFKQLRDVLLRVLG